MYFRLEENYVQEVKKDFNKEEPANKSNNEHKELSKHIINKSFLSFETFE